MTRFDPDKKAPLLDRIIDKVAPGIARRRAFNRFKAEHFRLMESNPDYRDLVFATMSARGYRASKNTKYQTPWGNSARSADAEIIPDLARLTSRSRELNRDDPIGSGLTRTFVNNVIGTGMRPQARTRDTDRNKAIEAVFKERKDHLHPADDMTHGESQRMKFRKVLEDGGVFVKMAKASPSEPLWFETVEKDRVKTPGDKTADASTGKIRDGVEKDENGVPVAYWVAKKHPGDIHIVSALNAKDFIRVERDSIRHLRIAERPGQTHGVPFCHAILQDIHDLDLLLVAGLKRMQIAACLAAFIKSSESIENMFDTTALTYGFELDQPITPGMMFKLYPNEEVQTLIPNFPTPELEPFIIMLARRIGSALGVSWQIVLKDFSKANYSSARTDLLEARQVYVAFQKWFIEKYLNWEWFEVLKDAKLRGDARLRGVSYEELASVHWIANGWHWVDPLKEAKATQLELQIGITSLRDVCAAQGKDWEEVLVQRIEEEKKERDMREKEGLPPPVKPVAKVPGTQVGRILDPEPQWRNRVMEYLDEILDNTDGNGRF